MAGRVGFIALLILAVGLLDGATATEYKVGDGYGWNLPPTDSPDFYTNWVANKTFFAGDSLVFETNGTHTVAEISQADYNICNTSAASSYLLIEKNVTMTRTYDKNGTYYIICSIDNHCELGMKFTLVIGDGIFDTGSASSLSVGAMAMLLSSFMVFLFSY